MIILGSIKRHIAGFLAGTLVLTGVNLTWLDLSPIIAKAAAAASDMVVDTRDGVVDNYQAVDNLQKEVADDVATSLGNATDAIDTTARKNSDKIQDIIWNNVQGLPHIKIFDQKDIDATAQVKSGKWMSDTDYEAMAGTPTTEDLFMTFGGTQWICDLQYRYVTADYIRKYHFDAFAYNYRYYKMGETGDDINVGTISYSAQAVINEEQDVVKTTHEDPELLTKGNYGYERFELTDETMKIPRSSGSVDTFKADMGQGTEMNSKTWLDVKWDSSVGSVAGDAATSTSYYTPNQTRAILVKKAFVQAMQRLQKMWEEQDDNYRRDEGVWDSDYDGLDDKLSFMYTYGAMARHTSIQYDSSNGANSSPGNAGRCTKTHDSVFNPCFTSYFYDWDGYSTGSLDTGYSSDVPTLKRTGYDSLREIVKDLKGSGDGKYFFAWNSVNNNIYRALFGETSTISNHEWTSVPIGYAQQLAKKIGVQAFVNVSDHDELLAFSNGLDIGSPDMLIGPDMLGACANVAQADLTNSGYIELVYLYYRAMYSLLFNFGQFFYRDELVELDWLFKDLPGYDISLIPENDGQIAENLAACFGQKDMVPMSAQGTGDTAVINIPFAMFPRGGDLDASIERRDVVDGGVDTLTAAELLATIEGDAKFRDYVYYVKVTISLKDGKTVDCSGDVKYDYKNVKVNAGKHADGTTNANPNITCNSIADPPPASCDKWNICTGNGTVQGTVACPNSAGTLPCATCGAQADAHTTVSGNVTDNHTCPTVDHYYSDLPGHEYVSDPDTGEYRSFKNPDDLQLCSGVAYKEKYFLKVNNSVEKITGFWVESPKSMSNKQTFGQNFKNVKWLDITAYTLWQMDHGESRGLSRLLASPVTNNDTLLTAAVDKLGYTVYNRNDGIRYNTDQLGLVRNLQSRYGRVANSFYYNSYGNSNSNVYNFERYPNGEYVGKRLPLMAYRQSDVPLIKTADSEDSASRYVNGDFHAYQVVKIGDGDTDDVYLKYNPYSQGGRSHTSFNGFINQALARTLYYKYNNGGTDRIEVYSRDTAYPYSNSLRIQGDYLSLERTDGTTLTMAGQLKDTWEMRTGNKQIGPSGQDYDGCQFRLLRFDRNDGSGRFLGDYVSKCNWVPARLTYLLGRAGYTTIYESTKVTSQDNTWIIHTYCGNINDTTHSCWDVIQGSSKCGRVYLPTDMGSINPKYQGHAKNHPAIFDLTELLADGSAGTSVATVDGVQAKVLNLGDDCVKDGANNHDMMTDRNIVMPYIGYGGDCNGTKLMTLDDNYTPGTTTTFDPTDTFVSGDTVTDGGSSGYNYYKGGFDQFGWNVTDEPPVHYDNVDRNNKARKNRDDNTKDDFSAKYPWLQDLNVVRNLPNRDYRTGLANIIYNRIGTENDCGTDIPSNSVHSTADKLSVNARYLRKPDASRNVDDKQFTRTPNDIVIFNPVATRSAHVEALSKYLPDAGNAGTDAASKVKYNGFYMDSFKDLTLRDQRVGLRYDGSDTSGSESYLTGSGISTGTLKQSNSYHWALKSLSEHGTKMWSMSDFNVMVNQTNSDIELNQNTNTITFSANGQYKAGVYTVNVYDRLGRPITFTKTFKDGDVLHYNGNYVSYSDVDLNVALRYQAFRDAYKAYEELKEVTNFTDTQQSVPIHKDMTMNIGAGYKMRKGSLIKITLPLDKEYSALPLTFVHDDDFTVEESMEGSNYVCYIESNVDTTLNTLSFKAKEELQVKYFPNTFKAIDAMDIVLVRMSDGASEDIAVDPLQVTTKSFYDINCNWGINYQGTVTAAINTRVVETYKGEYGVNVNISQCVKLTSIANACSVSYPVDKPHLAPNTNWRYYILGWKTTDGTFITDISMIDALPDNTVFDIQHYDDGHLVTLGELRSLVAANKLYVARFNGNYYLTDSTHYNATTRILPFNNIKITNGKFDIVSFGPTTTLSSETLIPPVPTGSFGVPDANGDWGTKIASLSYECVFKATIEDNYAWRLEYSMNTSHRCSIDVSLTEREKCWEKVKDYELQFSTENYTKVFADTLSLDDEFTIYWDNFDNLYQRRNGKEATLSNVETVQNNLGRGWDNLEDAHRNANVFKVKYNQSDIHAIPIWNKTDGNADYANDLFTDTTKWIYNKYMVFNVDIYGFTTGESFTLSNSDNDTKFDPTTPAFKSDGTPNNLVVIPAGTKVYCGRYTSDSNKADNNGRFVDYGNNKNNSGNGGSGTNQPNRERYTYHFWCPLSVGESLETATVQFVVNAINSTQTSGNTANVKGGKQALQGDKSVLNTKLFTNPYALRTKGGTDGKKDEWGEYIYKADTPYMLNNVHRLTSVEKRSVNNNGVENIANGEVLVNTFTQTETTRYCNSLNSDTLSVAGRLGGLTVVDTEDPRYQDTFKLPEATATYAIAPIVWAVTRYSNVPWSNPPYEGSTQNRYLTDVTDVRGRIGRLLSKIGTDGSGYKVTEKGTLDTYGSQWVLRNDADWAPYQGDKGTDVNRTVVARDVLPMSGTFNVHSELDNIRSKLGYDMLCSMFSIGNYYGSAGPRSSSDNPVNNNLDYGQTKVQVMPRYIFIPKNPGPGDKPEAVDVYIRKGSDYALINAGSIYGSKEIEEAIGGGNGGPYFLEAAYSSNSVVSINTNKEGMVSGKYKLSDEMLRKLVTADESLRSSNTMAIKDKTKAPIQWKLGITKTMLDRNSYGDSSQIGGEGLTYEYIYGNSQIMFMREYNRTFVGGQLSFFDKVITDTVSARYANMRSNSQVYGQKWYFNLGLPASSVFVKHGEDPISKNILNGKEGYILVALDIYAIGEKFITRYQSPLVNSNVKVDGEFDYDVRDWNVYDKGDPHLIPVSFYDLDQSDSSNDVDTQGTH